MSGQRLARGVTQVLNVVLVVLMALLVVVIFAQVFSRYVVGSSIAWTEELARYLLIYLTFIGSAVAVHEHAHLRVDFLVVRLPALLQRIIGIATSLGIAIAAGFLLYYGATYTLLATGTVSPALEQSIAWVYAVMPVAGLLMLAYLVPHVVDQITGRERSSAHPGNVPPTAAGS
ncbi:TRAP transporter small permease [Pseudonocardia sichuanensis]